MAWTDKSITKLYQDNFKNHMFVVASTTEPYLHTYTTEEVKAARATGGTVTALEPIIKAIKGLWVAYARGSADREVIDDKGHISLPPRKPRYTLRRLWLNKEELKGWYYGFSNQALWPLCHNVFERPVFQKNHWDMYVAVNKKYAEAILEEVEGKEAVVWIQDYQLALVPKFLQEKRPDLIIAAFWHIPWPVVNIFTICPWSREILEGLLGCQLIGFQRPAYVRNFLLSVGKCVEAKVDMDAQTVTFNNKVTYVRHFPVSIDYKAVSAASAKSRRYGKSFLKQFVPAKYEFLSLGIERLDYTKGLVERFKAIDRFLEKYPEYQERFTHVNILSSSRSLIKRYEDLGREIENLVEEVNFKYSTPSWQPIYLIRQSLPPAVVYNFCKSAAICMVTSLADGMNLVAKEYVTAGPEDGALILSEQTGAADELTEALIVNPYDIEGLSDRIKLALEMPKAEKKARMEKMRELLAKQNVYRWAGKFLADLADLKSRGLLATETQRAG